MERCLAAMKCWSMLLCLVGPMILSWATNAEAYPVFFCHVTKLDRTVMNSFGDVMLEVYRPHGSPQPDALLQVEITTGDERILQLGRSLYTGGKEYRCKDEQQICYNATSTHVDVGYLLNIDILNGGKGELLGYPTNLPGHPDILKIAKSFAEVRCRRVAP